MGYVHADQPRLDPSRHPSGQPVGNHPGTSGKLLPSDSFAQSTYKRWTTYQYSLCCLLASERLYHAIPASGSGDEGTNYDQTSYGYDSAKRRIRRTSPGGTITRWVYDGRSNIIGIYVGTDDTGATPTDPTGGGAQGNNMKLIEGKQFDQGNDGGDNNLTQLTQPVSGSTQRVTNFVYDWRNRQIEVQGELDYFLKTTYDNLNRAIQAEQRIGSAAGQLLSRSQSLYDPLGRLFRSIGWGVDPDTGSVTYPLTTNHWFDPTGNAAKSHGPGSDQFTKTVYDSLNRAVVRYEAYGDDSTYNDAMSITGNVVLEQTETSYDDADSAIATIIRQRYHDAPAAQTGPLGNPGSAPKARVTYAAEYADPLGRTIASADWGTAGGSGWSRPATIPASSDTILVSQTGYNEAGEAFQVIDPAGKEDRTDYDAAGRRTELIENYVSSSSGGSSGNGCAASDDENVTTQFTYTADGDVGEQKVINAETGDQITKYIYGTTLSDSEIASSQLLRRVEYPDSTGPTDSVQYSYNRQSDTIGLEDQNGNVHAYDYDQRGRRTQDRVTTLGSGVDGAVRRIATTYTPLDRVETITSYDAPGVGSGNVVNQVQFKYNAFGQSIETLQNTSGAVNPSTSPSVQSAYADGSANTIRPLSLTYPSGRQITLDYGSSGSIDDSVGRVVSLIDSGGGSIHLADYQYLGLGMVVRQDSPQADLRWTLIDLTGSDDPDTGDIYSGLDRFGRVKDARWRNTDTSSDLSRVLYGYDRASNRLWRENPSDSSRRYDWLYSYDGLHRLHTAERGELNSGHTAITSPQFGQCWTLDPTGNWEGFRQDDNGNGTWNLIQARTANPVNEITDIDNTTGNSWANPDLRCQRQHDGDYKPRFGDRPVVSTRQWDAWNRLVKSSTRVTRNHADPFLRRAELPREDGSVQFGDAG
jgi:YD repeat-containing protein